MARNAYRYDRVLFALWFARNAFNGAFHVIRMVVTIRPQQRLDTHSEIAGSLPRVDAGLHQPGRGRVTQSVRRNFSRKFGQYHGGRGPDGLAETFSSAHAC